mgnify:CR=1 FL=1
MEGVLIQGLVTNKNCTYSNIKKYVVVNFSNKTKKYLIAKSEIILVNYYNKTKKSDSKIRTYTHTFLVLQLNILKKNNLK